MEKFLLSAPPAFSAGCRALSLLSLSEVSSLLAAAPMAGAGTASGASGAADFVLRAAARLRPAVLALRGALLAHTDLSPAAVDALTAAAEGVRAARRRAAPRRAGPRRPPPSHRAACTRPRLRSPQRGYCSSSDSSSALPPPAPLGAPCTSLESASWALAVAHRSSACAALAAPCLVLDLRLRRAQETAGSDATGNDAAGDGAAVGDAAAASVWHERIELTLGQLAFLEATLRDAVNAVERA